MNKEKMVILINSTDSYSDIWDMFFDSFFKFWPDCTFKIILLTNELNYKRENVDCFTSYKGANWSERINFNINRINSKYIFLILEDHILTKKIENESILKILEEIQKFKDFGYVRLNQSKIKMGKKIDEKYLLIDKSYPYNLSTLEAIWSSNFLFELTKNKWNPWEFEKKGSVKSIAYKNKFYMVKNNIIDFDNAIIRSKWNKKFYKKYKYTDFDFSSRKINSFIFKDFITLKTFLNKIDFLKILLHLKRLIIYFKRKKGGLL